MYSEVFEFDRVCNVKYGSIVGLWFGKISWLKILVFREKFCNCNGRVFMIKSFFHNQNVLKIGFENVFGFSFGKVL
jgi:hypothetical protein